jgi:hypothetical protein
LRNSSFTPSIATVPASGGCNPNKVRNNVVFPAPFGPSRHSTSPGRTVKEMPLPTTRLP